MSSVFTFQWYQWPTLLPLPPWCTSCVEEKPLPEKYENFCLFFNYFGINVCLYSLMDSMFVYSLNTQRLTCVYVMDFHTKNFKSIMLDVLASGGVYVC